MLHNKPGSTKSIITTTIALLIVSLLFALTACDEKSPGEDNKGNDKKEQPKFDQAKAKTILSEYVWEGVISGKPVLFIAVDRNGQLVGAMEIGKDKHNLTITIRKNGQIIMETREQPVNNGMAKVAYYGTLDKEMKILSGNGEYIVKSGFMEQATEIGKWSLKRTKSRKELKKNNKTEAKTKNKINTVAPETKKEPESPKFDKEKAKKTLLENTWKGIISGKPATLIPINQKGQLMGELTLGKNKQTITITIRDDGRIIMATEEQPVNNGMARDTYYGNFDAEMKSLSGEGDRIVQSGFIQQGNGLGKWTLKSTEKTPKK